MIDLKSQAFEIGLVLPMGESFADGSTARWTEIRDLAVRAEELGFDTVWVADELLWRTPGGQTNGWWECVAMAGAVAATTSQIKVGTWVLSALHRNPGITAKAVETLDEISGGRFVLGLGSGHAGDQARAFGLPEDHVIGRFAEAVEIIVPILCHGRSDF
ncbi:MAG: putative dehydrogenase, partial [Chloroflexi bacterium]|nr:putative dehydrogenase [Chloroflexota bacterium]